MADIPLITYDRFINDFDNLIKELKEYLSKNPSKCVLLYNFTNLRHDRSFSKTYRPTFEDEPDRDPFYEDCGTDFLFDFPCTPDKFLSDDGKVIRNLRDWIEVAYDFCNTMPANKYVCRIHQLGDDPIIEHFKIKVLKEQDGYLLIVGPYKNPERYYILSLIFKSNRCHGYFD